MLVGVPLTMALGLLAAVGLNQGVVKFRTLFRVGFYLPVVTSIVAIAVVWRLLLGTETGLINGVLEHASASTARAGSPTSASPSGRSSAMAVWRGPRVPDVIFLAGLQTIPEDLYEAAEVDGASRVAALLGITLPLLRPTLLFGASSPASAASSSSRSLTS